MNANPLSRTFLIPRAKPSSDLPCVRQSAITAQALKVYPRNLTQCVPVSKSRKPHHVCLAGGKGMMDNSEYIYVINGVELTKLARDFITYLLGGTQSVRLKRASYKWARFYKVTGKIEVDENGLEKAPTQWNVADF